MINISLGSHSVSETEAAPTASLQDAMRTLITSEKGQMTAPTS